MMLKIFPGGNRRAAFFWLLPAFFLICRMPGYGEELPLAASPEAVGMSSEILRGLDDLMADSLAQKRFPGSVLLVTRNGKIVWRKAYGLSRIVPQSRPMETGMLFDLASLTKPMATATSIMILVERGKIRLLDRVRDYIPEFSRQGPDQKSSGSSGGDVRIWHLLTHTSGLPAYMEPEAGGKSRTAFIQTKDLVEHIARIKEESAPGRKFVYSCLNYIVLARIVQSVSGRNIAEFAEENIFRPLGMTKTFFVPSDDWKKSCVATAVIDGVPLQGIVHDPLARLQGGISGNAGLFSTADDLAVFAAMMLGKGAFGGKRILSPLSVERMTEIYPKARFSGRGLGWDVASEYAGAGGDLFGPSAYGHTGYTGTSLWIDPETGVSVVFLTNRIHPDDKGEIVSVRSKAANIVAASILDKKPGASK